MVVAPTEHVEVGPPLPQLRDVLAHRRDREIDGDADLGQHAGDRAADRLVVEVAVLRAVEPHLETVRVAGLGQQGLGRVRVVGQARVELRRVAIDPRLDDHARGYREAAHDPGRGSPRCRSPGRPPAGPAGPRRVRALDVRRAQLRAALVEAEEDGPELHRLLEPDAGRAREPVELGERWVVQEVDLAREQGGHALPRVGDRGELDPVNVVRVLGQAPPVGVPDQHHARAGLVRLQHERAGAVGVVLDVGDLGIGVGCHLDRAMPLRPGLGHDADVEQLRPAGSGSAPTVRTRTTWSPTASTAAIGGMPAANSDCGDSARRRLKTTSSAVSGVPSWKRTPWRSSNSQVVGSTRRQATASPGLMLWSESKSTRDS